MTALLSERAVMRTKVDSYFYGYFSGQYKSEYEWRLKQLRNPKSKTDENVGGGKLENVNTAKSSVENRIIKVADDERLNKILNSIDAVDGFIKTIDSDEVELLRMRYKRHPETWHFISYRLCKSDRQLQDDLKRIKQEFRNSFYYPVDN